MPTPMKIAKSVTVQTGSRADRIQVVRSPGGIEAWLIEEHSVPLIALEVSFEGGTAQDPADQSGLANLMAGLLDEGAGALDSTAFQERIDDHAIQMRFSAGRDEISGSLKTLVRHKDEAFRLFGLALTEPRFDPDAIERVKAQIVSGLRRRQNDPNAMASKAWFAAAFPGHPYGRTDEGDEASVAKLKQSDMRACFKRLIARSNMKLSVVGAITAAELAPQLDAMFGGLPKSALLTPVADIAPKGLGQRQILPLDLPQSTVRFGMAGLLRKDPDFVAATVMNHILGGGSFTSRIWQEVREKRGLAYSVSTGLYPYRNAGLFFGGTATKNERVKEAIDVIEAEIARMAEKGPTREELKKALSYLTGSYALRFDTSTKIANQLTMIQVEGLGIDYIDRRNADFERVTLADVKRVAKRLLAPGALLVTIAGNPQGY
jgi:zinc protease